MAGHTENARHLEAFEFWQNNGRNFSKTCQNFPVSKPTLYAWADKFNWIERADARDAKVAAAADERAIAVRLARIEEQRQLGELIRNRSTEFFIGNKIDNAGVALSAARLGIDIERQADGLPDWIIAILNGTPDDLEKLERELEELDTVAETAGALDAGLSQA